MAFLAAAASAQNWTKITAPALQAISSSSSGEFLVGVEQYGSIYTSLGGTWTKTAAPEVPWFIEA